MYFAILEGYYDSDMKYLKNNVNPIRNFLNKIPEVERLKDDFYYIHYYHLSLKNLRKLKILSLTDENIKRKLTRLESLLWNETKINIYGNKKPAFGTSGIGSTGTSGTSGSSGPKGFYKNDRYNRFAQKPKKNFDFHKIKNKNLIKK